MSRATCRADTQQQNKRRRVNQDAVRNENARNGNLYSVAARRGYSPASAYAAVNKERAFHGVLVMPQGTYGVLTRRKTAKCSGSAVLRGR